MPSADVFFSLCLSSPPDCPSLSQLFSTQPLRLHPMLHPPAKFLLHTHKASSFPRFFSVPGPPPPSALSQITHTSCRQPKGPGLPEMQARSSSPLCSSPCFAPSDAKQMLLGSKNSRVSSGLAAPDFGSKFFRVCCWQCSRVHPSPAGVGPQRGLGGT